MNRKTLHVWNVEGFTDIKRVLSHIEGLQFAIIMTNDSLELLNENVKKSVTRLGQLKPDYAKDLNKAIERAQKLYQNLRNKNGINNEG